MPHDEATLVRKCQAGDRDAFDRLVLAHENRVFRVCLRLLRDTDEATACAQDVFVEVWRGIRSFRGDSSLATWLHAVAVHQCRQAIRRKQRIRERGEYSLDSTAGEGDSGRPLSERLAAKNRAPDRGLEEADAASLVSRALGMIPHAFREAIVLRELEGMTYQEAARALGVRAGTLKSRISRGRAALQQALVRLTSRKDRR